MAVGGIAPRPWRVEAAEGELPHGAKAVAGPLLKGAKPTDDNKFKLKLAERTLGAVLAEAKGAKVELMKFDTPATTNPIDQLKVVGKPTDRIDGKLKTTGTAPYAYERHDVVPNQAYGFVLGAAIAKGRISGMDLDDAKAAPGVITIVSTLDMPKLPRSKMNIACLFGGAGDRALSSGHRARGG